MDHSKIENHPVIAAIIAVAVEANRDLQEAKRLNVNHRARDAELTGVMHALIAACEALGISPNTSRAFAFRIARKAAAEC